MQQLPVHYDPTVLDDTIRSQRVRWILGALGTTLQVFGVLGLVLYAYYVVKGRSDSVWDGFTIMMAISAGVGMVLLLVQLLWLRRLRRARSELGVGLAMVLSNRGIETAEGATPWEDVVSLAAAPGEKGRGTRLDIQRRNKEPLVFPLECLSLLPGSLDSAVRAYSGGRRGIDLSHLDD